MFVPMRDPMAARPWTTSGQGNMPPLLPASGPQSHYMAHGFFPSPEKQRGGGRHRGCSMQGIGRK
jgi:hypothetical protein